MSATAFRCARATPSCGRAGTRCAARQHGAGAQRAGRHRQRPARSSRPCATSSVRARAAERLRPSSSPTKPPRSEQPRARLTVRERADDEPHELPLNQWSLRRRPLDQAARRHQAASRAISTNSTTRRRNPKVPGLGFAATARCRKLAALRPGGDRGHRAAGSPMRWPSASRRPAATCATTSPRLQSRRSGPQGLRRHPFAHRRRRPHLLQHAVQPAGAHRHPARGPRLPGERVPVLDGDARRSR